MIRSPTRKLKKQGQKKKLDNGYAGDSVRIHLFSNKKPSVKPTHRFLIRWPELDFSRNAIYLAFHTTEKLTNVEMSK